MKWLATIGMLALTACGTPVVAPRPPSLPPPPPSQVPDRLQSPEIAARNFVEVIYRMRPVAMRECNARTRGVRCDYAIVIDDRPGVPPNAFQTRAPDGQPVIGFTLPLIAEARNTDELAFILGHEAAHHIAGHIDRGRRSAAEGAVLAGAMAQILGGDEIAIRRAQQVGADVGQRRYGKTFELEADALGAVLTLRAGFDPVRGVAYFERVPDPGNRFLGSHPPNAQRVDTVRRVAAGYAGR
nr:M48 family metallopeptidase [Oceaniovalibus guishaninsula]